MEDEWTVVLSEDLAQESLLFADVHLEGICSFLGAHDVAQLLSANKRLRARLVIRRIPAAQQCTYNGPSGFDRGRLFENLTLSSDLSAGTIRRVILHATWEDQGWGFRKGCFGVLRLRLSDVPQLDKASFDEKVNFRDVPDNSEVLFTTTSRVPRQDECKALFCEMDVPPTPTRAEVSEASEASESEEGRSDADVLSVWVRAGGGGGHRIVVSGFTATEVTISPSL